MNLNKIKILGVIFLLLFFSACNNIAVIDDTSTDNLTVELEYSGDEIDNITIYNINRDTNKILLFNYSGGAITNIEVLNE